MLNSFLIVVLCFAGGVITLGILYIIRLHRMYKKLLDHYEELSDQNWELKRANRYFKRKDKRA
jgi:membrane protein DedA with SNARE-associated domain